MQLSLICGSCRFDRASNDEFSVEFWMFSLIFFFQPASNSDRSERSRIHSKLSLLSKGILIIPWRCPKFQNSAEVEKHKENKYSKFDTKFIIWRPVEMAWSRHEFKIKKYTNQPTYISYWLKFHYFRALQKKVVTSSGAIAVVQIGFVLTLANLRYWVKQIIH